MLLLELCLSSLLVSKNQSHISCAHAWQIKLILILLLKLILNGKLKEMKKNMELHMTGVSSLTVISNLPEIIINDLAIIPGGTF